MKYFIQEAFKIKSTKFIVLIIMFFTLVGCSNSIGGKIPELEITTNHEDVLVTRGGYNWTTKLNVSEVADTDRPLHIANDIEGTHVLPESQLKLQFSKTPNRITVLAWHEQGADEWSSSNDTFTTPAEKGTYIFEIIANWDQGTVSYITKLIVE